MSNSFRKSRVNSSTPGTYPSVVGELPDASLRQSVPGVPREGQNIEGRFSVITSRTKSPHIVQLQNYPSDVTSFRCNVMTRLDPTVLLYTSKRPCKLIMT